MITGRLLSKFYSKNLIFPEEKLSNLCKKIKNNEYTKIAVLLGKGIHTSSGVLSLESEEIRKELSKHDVPFPEALFDLNYFQLNPFPLYKILNKLVPDTARPSLSHSFVKALEDKNLLLLAFTKNIDSLELQAGISRKKIVFAHGNMEKFSCSSCNKPKSTKICLEHVKFEEPPFCECGSPVKPNMLFVGESISQEFYNSSEMLAYADLMIIIGCYLTVFPFSTLPMVNNI